MVSCKFPSLTKSAITCQIRLSQMLNSIRIEILSKRPPLRYTILKYIKFMFKTYSCRVLSFIVFTPFLNFAQSDSTVFAGNHLSVMLSNAINQTTVASASGNEVPNFSASHMPMLNLGYTFNFKSNFGATLEGAVGVHTKRFSYTTVPGHTYETPVASLAVFGEARTFKVSRVPLAILAGGGVTFYGRENFSSTFVNTTYSGGNSSSVYSLVKGEYNGARPFVSVGLKVSQILRNQDLLFFSFRYNAAFGSIASGTYSLENASSEGGFECQGSNLHFGLGYAFTRAKKRAEIQERWEETDATKREAKKDLRKEKRYFDPKSSFVELSGGRFLTQTREVGGQDFFQTMNTESLAAQLSFEKGIKNYFYWKASLTQASYLMQARVHGAKGAGVQKLFNATGINLGFGKRLMLQNNYNILNVEAGIGLNAHFKAKGFQQESGSYAQDANNDTLFSYHYNLHLNQSLFPTVFLGASKDFQIGKAFYVSLAYRFNLGFTQPASMNVAFSDATHDNTLTIVEVNGTSHTISLGFKYRLPQK